MTTVIVVNIMYVGFSSRNEFSPGLVWVRFILLFYLISSHISQLFFPGKLSPVLWSFYYSLFKSNLSSILMFFSCQCLFFVQLYNILYPILFLDSHLVIHNM